MEDRIRIVFDINTRLIRLRAAVEFKSDNKLSINLQENNVDHAFLISSNQQMMKMKVSTSEREKTETQID